MASTIETGHAKNVATFEDLISFCTGYGGRYNPSRPDLQLPALQQLHADAIESINNVKATKADFARYTNQRQDVFKPIRMLSSRVINALAASGAGDRAVKDARTINRKIMGGRTAALNEEPVTTDTAAEIPKNISVSQQSYDSLIDHFAQLINLLSIETDYQPNEAEISLSGLNQYIATLQQANTQVINSYTAFSNARIFRKEKLYNSITGIIAISLAVKSYVKSVFGATSDQYRQLSALAFRAIKD